MPRLTPEFKALSAFRQTNKRVVTCGDTGYLIFQWEAGAASKVYLDPHTYR